MVLEFFYSPTMWMGIYDSSKAAVRIMTEVLSLECRALSIHVMLISAGVIKSNMLGGFDNYELPEDSLYKSYARAIWEHLDFVQQPRSMMPAEDFAEESLSKALSSSPPSYVLAGGQ